MISGRQTAGEKEDPEELKTLNLPGGKSTAKAAASSSSPIMTRAPEISISGVALPVPQEERPMHKKPLVMEMKDKPELEADYSDPTVIKLIITVELENSAKNIDLDVADKQLKLESAK